MIRQGGLLIRSITITHSYWNRIKIIAYVLSSLQIQDTLYLFLFFSFICFFELYILLKDFIREKIEIWRFIWIRNNTIVSARWNFSLLSRTEHLQSWNIPILDINRISRQVCLTRQFLWLNNYNFFFQFPPSANESNRSFHDFDDQRYFPRKRTNIRWYSVRKMNRGEQSWEWFARFAGQRREWRSMKMWASKER